MAIDEAPLWPPGRLCFSPPQNSSDAKTQCYVQELFQAVLVWMRIAPRVLSMVQGRAIFADSAKVLFSFGLSIYGKLRNPSGRS